MSNFERIYFIDKHIRETGSVSIKTVMDEFEVSERQVERDLSIMRLKCDAPLKKNQHNGRFEYDKPFDDLGFLDEDALLLKLLLYKVAGASQFIPYNRREFMRKIENIVPQQLKPLENAIRFELPSFERVDRARLSLLLHSINDKTRISIVYVDGAGKESERVVEPRRLLNYSGAWYCLCVDPIKGEVRNFKLSRIHNASRLRERQSSSLPDVEIDKAMEEAYGAYKGDGHIHATIRFTGPALAIVRDETWHADQEIVFGKTENQVEYLDLSLNVHRFEELLGRILRFGSDAEPLEPEQLRNAWVVEIEKMYKKINPPTTGVGGKEYS